ncbi:MAG: SPOR domain-containing protein [Steroidobacteraceae bacterium]
MNKQFKERLTGAVILVAFVVIVVPALLSGPPRTAAPETVAGGEGPPLRTYTIDLTDPAGSTPPIATPAAPPAEAAPQAAATPMAPVTPVAPAAATDASPVPKATPEPIPAEPVPAKPAPAAPAAGYAVQIGSFGDPANADRLVATLHKGGFAAFIVPTRDGRTLYRVRVGPVADRADAERLAARLVAAGQSGRIVPHP